VFPRNTPHDIVGKTYDALSTMLKSPETQSRFLAQGAFASGIPPEEFTAFVKAEVDKWARIAKAAHIRLN
jgi:tripartite-type tricarboxylate transporter receptor subunit TctC